MPGPTPSDVALTLGVVILGAAIWRALNTDFRSYAAEDVDIYDCDDKGCRRRKRFPGFSEMANPGGDNPSFSAPERPPPPNELGSFNRDEGQYKYLKPGDQAELAAKRRAAYNLKQASKKQEAPKTLSGYISKRLGEIFSGKPFPSPTIPLESPAIGIAQPIMVAPIAYAATTTQTTKKCKIVYDTYNHPVKQCQICSPVKLFNGRILNTCILSKPGYMINRGGNVVDPLLPDRFTDPRSDPLHPTRGRDAKGKTFVEPGYGSLEYPSLDPQNIQPEYSTETRNTTPDIASEYAYAY